MPSEREPDDLTNLPGLLAQAEAEPDWRRRCEFIRPFVAAMVDAKLWLAERDVLLSRAAVVFGCAVSSLLVDLRRARLQRAQDEEQREVADLERWYQS